MKLLGKIKCNTNISKVGIRNVRAKAADVGDIDLTVLTDKTQIPERFDDGENHYEAAEAVYREANGIAEGVELDDDRINMVWLYACDHIGLFIHWLIDNGMVAGKYADPIGISLVKSGELTGMQFAINYCDYAIPSDMVRKDVIPFVMNCFKNDEYYNGYLEELGIEKPYGKISSKEDYEKIRRMLDKDYKGFNELFSK